MSILIKGMKMPTSCDDCDFIQHGYSEDWCYITGKNLPCNCPLIPIPPHGDLIERDALEVHDGWMNEDREKNVQQTHITFVYSNDIANAPIIVEAEGEEEG